jgi:hypothetical protein
MAPAGVMSMSGFQNLSSLPGLVAFETKSCCEPSLDDTVHAQADEPATRGTIFTRFFFIMIVHP